MSEKTKSVPNTNPEAHKLVTEANASAALVSDKGCDAKLKSFEVIDFTSKGDNYACFVTSVKVCYTLANETKCVTYVVKINPCRNIPAFESFTTTIFEKEAKFYTVLVPEFDAILDKIEQPRLRVPKCFYVSYEPLKQIIYLEDMRVKCFKMFDRMKGLDDAHTKLVVEELARLHAASVLLESSLGDDTMINKYPFLKEVFMDDSNPEGLEIFNNMFQGFIQNGSRIAEKLQSYGKVSKFIDSIAPKAVDMLMEQMQSEAPFTVVCHGDCWNNNLLFRYDDVGNPLEVCLLDLQVNRHGSFALDLNYLFFTSLTGDTRKQGLMSFLSSYHSSYKTVVTAAKKEMVLTQDDVYREYRNRHIFGLLMSIMVIPLVVMESTDVPDFQDISEANLEEMLAESQQKTLDRIDTSPALRPRFLDMFDEMIEHGIIKIEK